MNFFRDNGTTILLFVTLALILVSVAITYYQTLVVRDFVIIDDVTGYEVAE